MRIRHTAICLTISSIPNLGIGNATIIQQPTQHYQKSTSKKTMISLLLKWQFQACKKKDFHLELDQNFLTISSIKNKDGQTDDAKYSRREFAYHSFQRSFNLPDTADGEKINASYKNGILNVSIPKKEEAKPKPPKTIGIS